MFLYNNFDNKTKIVKLKVYVYMLVILIEFERIIFIASTEMNNQLLNLENIIAELYSVSIIKSIFRQYDHFTENSAIITPIFL